MRENFGLGGRGHRISERSPLPFTAQQAEPGSHVITAMLNDEDIVVERFKVCHLRKELGEAVPVPER